MKQTAYVIYGIRVDIDPRSWVELEESPGQCTNNGEVGYFQAGLHDRSMTFLATECREAVPGDYAVIVPGATITQDRLEAHWRLAREAERLGCTIIDGPGWIFVVDES